MTSQDLLHDREYLKNRFGHQDTYKETVDYLFGKFIDHDTKTNAPEHPSHLPPMHRSYSFLIYGGVGTGKSRLMIQVLSSIPNSMLITSRLPARDYILDNQIMLREKKITFIDVTGIGGRQEEQFLGQDIYFVRYETIADFFQQTFQIAEKKEIKNIGVDSWSAFLPSMMNEEISYWEKTLISQCKQRNINVFFILDSETINNLSTSIPWLVDAVYELKWECWKLGEEKLPYRLLVIHKAKNRDLDQHAFTYSMMKGKFRIIFPNELRVPAVLSPLKPIPDPFEGKLSSGIEELDSCQSFDGFYHGSASLFQVSYSASALLPYFMASMYSNFLNLGKIIIEIPTEMTFHRLFYQYLANIVTSSRLENLHSIVFSIPQPAISRISWVPLLRQHEKKSGVFFLKTIKDIIDTYLTTRLQQETQIYEELEKGTDSDHEDLRPRQPSIVLSIGIDTLLDKLESQVVKDFFLRLEELVTSYSLVLIAWYGLGEKESPYQVVKKFPSFQSYYVISRINNAYFLKSLKKTDTIYAIEPCISSGYQEFHIIKMI